MITSIRGKLLGAFVLVLTLSFAAAGAAFGISDSTVMEVAPFIDKGVTYDTVRSIAETFGIYVYWDQEGQAVTLIRGANQVKMTVGETELAIVTPEGEETLAIDTPPVIKEGRVFLPTRLWAESFGLSVQWQAEDGSVTVSEGAKALTFTPGSRELALTGGHFLKLYHQEGILSFFYPRSGEVDVVWEGYAEVLLTVEDEDYLIVAVNAGAGRADPVNYTMEEFDRLIYENASMANGSVRKLPDTYFGVPAYRIAGKAESVPQAGVVFLIDGYLCGITVEVKRTPIPEEHQHSDPDIVTDTEPDEDLEEEPEEIDPDMLASELVVVNALLDEIMASFKAYKAI